MINEKEVYLGFHIPAVYLEDLITLVQAKEVEMKLLVMRSQEPTVVRMFNQRAEMWASLAHQFQVAQRRAALKKL